MIRESDWAEFVKNFEKKLWCEHAYGPWTAQETHGTAPGGRSWTKRFERRECSLCGCDEERHRTVQYQ